MEPMGDATIIQVAMTPNDRTKGGGHRIRIRTRQSSIGKVMKRGEGVRSKPRDMQDWKRCYLYILLF